MDTNNKYSETFLDELERFVEAGASGDFSINLDLDNLSGEEQKVARLLKKALDCNKSAVEYDLMKYMLASEALGIGHWDMVVVEGDPVNPDNRFIWSREFRQMLGFSDENDFPNVFHSWSDQLHPEDRDMAINAFAAHFNDRSGKTPYDIEYRLKLKNGGYRYFRGFGTTFRNSAGVPLRVAGAMMDITEKKRMESEIAKANERTKILLDKTPLCCQLWDSNFKKIDCNEAAVGLFGFKDKGEFFERYSELYPEYQPDGERSYEKVAKFLKKAFDEGGSSFDWTYKMLDGTSMPAEVIFIRVEYEDGYGVAGYTRDMREHNKMMKGIEYRDNLLRAVNRAAAVLLNSDIDSFENSLYQSMRVLTEAVAVDRMRIWKNNTRGAGLYSNQLYEWSKDAGPRHDDEITPRVHHRDQIPEWEEILSRGNCINRLVSDMPPEAQAQLSPQGILTLFAAPVFVEDQFWGSVTFENCSEERIFTEEEESILRSGGVLFAEALLRNEMVINIRDTAVQLKTSAQKMLEDEERMQLMLDAMPLTCHLIGLNYEIIDCNQEALNLFGLADKEEYREKYYGLLPEFQPCGRQSLELTYDYIEKAFDEGYLRFEWLYEKPGGELLPCEVTLVRVRYKGVYVIAEYARDLREQKAVIEEMRRAEIAEESNKAKSQFLANMSHEIRTPMNSIMGFAELALDTPDNGITPQVRDYLGKITDSTKWLLNIIDDILDISKIESGKMELEHAPFNLQDVFSRCQSTILPSVKEKSLDFRVYVESPTGKKLMGDSVRLYQALMNILSNAVKFTDAGTIKFSSMIKSSDEGNAAVYFEIKDSGIGMSPGQVEKIFEPFIQADSSTTRNYGGTGLGLTITKNIVELMGGKLAVESSPGAGSTFSFEIMFEITDAPDDISDPAKFNLFEKPNFEGLILICEDNLMNQQVISEHFERVGLHAVIAENGKIGVEMVRERIHKGEKPFDMIFMDMFMPVMDGIEAASIIMALDTGTPIVAMTANVMISELEKYRKHGMRDCLGKPFTSQELWHILLKYLTPVGSSAVDEYDQDNSELQRKLRINFVKDNRTKYAEFTRALESDDIKLAHRLAHTLKSNAGQIGKTILQQAAANIERQLKDGHNLVTPRQMITLETELSAALAEFAPLLDEPRPEAAVPAEPLDPEAALELFLNLAPMLEMGNPECRNLLGSLRRIPGSEELIRQIEDLDFEPAVVTLAELKGKIKGKK